MVINNCKYSGFEPWRENIVGPGNVGAVKYRFLNRYCIRGRPGPYRKGCLDVLDGNCLIPVGWCFKRDIPRWALILVCRNNHSDHEQTILGDRPPTKQAQLIMSSNFAQQTFYEFVNLIKFG